MTVNRPKISARHRGFTMIEIMLALMILGIGLIMVASIFPVAANWTRENAEETVAANIAQNAVSIIKVKYSATDVSGVGATVQALPDITGASAKLSYTERAYEFGVDPPYPVPSLTAAANSLYWWTAAVRLDPSGGNKYDLYIFVFKKGAANQTFTAPSTGELTGERDATNDPQSSANIPLTPTLKVGLLDDTNFLVGSEGVGQTTGTVYRKLSSTTATTTYTGENIIYSLPADGTSVSPLVYIYQTTVSF